MPSGKKAYPKIQDNKDGTVTVRYQPTETGLHELFVKYNNDDIEGEGWIHKFWLFLCDSILSWCYLRKKKPYVKIIFIM